MKSTTLRLLALSMLGTFGALYSWALVATYGLAAAAYTLTTYAALTGGTLLLAVSWGRQLRERGEA